MQTDSFNPDAVNIEVCPSQPTDPHHGDRWDRCSIGTLAVAIASSPTMEASDLPLAIARESAYPVAHHGATAASVHLQSTLQDLVLHDFQVDADTPTHLVNETLTNNPLLPGVILTQDGEFLGMLSRRQFLEEMSRPYGLALFSRRPIRALYEFIAPQALILAGDVAIATAVHHSLQRPVHALYDPIVVQLVRSATLEEQPGTVPTASPYQLLDIHHLLLAQAQIHTLTTDLYSQSQLTATTATAQADQLRQALWELQQAQTQLIQSEKMSSLGQLVAGIAHEINNPVNFIFGNLSHTQTYIQDLLDLLELYHQHLPNPPAAIQAHRQAIDLDFLIEDLPKMLQSMQVGADRIRQLVLSLRNFSRLDESELKAVDIHEGIDSTLVILQNRLKGKGGEPSIQVVKHYGQLPLVDCYPGPLNQVFMNLISNAIEALEDCRHRPAQICITTELVSSHRVKIRIADNGPGIPTAIQSKLFDPFFTTKPVGKGTGLGLSISHQIITQKHAGQIGCVSEVGQGTEFWLEIPVRRG